MRGEMRGEEMRWTHNTAQHNTLSNEEVAITKKKT